MDRPCSRAVEDPGGFEFSQTMRSVDDSDSRSNFSSVRTRIVAKTASGETTVSIVMRFDLRSTCSVKGHSLDSSSWASILILIQCRRQDTRIQISGESH